MDERRWRLLWRPRLVWAVLLLGLTLVVAPLVSAQPSLLNAFDTVLQRVIALRHLTPKRAIKREVRSRASIRAAVLALVHDALSPAEWEAERKAMLQWGLIPPEFRLRDFVLDLLTEQAAGYYDPQQRTFFIADWLPQDIQKPVMAHELVHALQDQYYDLQKNFDLVKEHADLTLARKALIEGDAMAVMWLYLMEPLGLSLAQLPDLQWLGQSGTSWLGESFHVYAQAPLILQQQLLFPYTHGLAFLKAALAHGGWEGLERVYRHPPLSTKHILHPETYFRETPDIPHEVMLALAADTLPAPWKKIKRDVLGEFLLAVTLQQFLPEGEAKRSAAGWQGDRYELFEEDGTGQLLLVCVTVWESPEDAAEFFQSYVKLLRRKYPGWEITALDDDSGHLWQHERKRVVLRQHAQQVQIVEGVPEEVLPRLLSVLNQVTTQPTSLR